VQIVVNSSLDVLGCNTRYVIKISDTAVGDVLMVIVGAAAVGSIRLHVTVGDTVEKGTQPLATSSCSLLCFAEQAALAVCASLCASGGQTLAVTDTMTPSVAGIAAQSLPSFHVNVTATNLSTARRQNCTALFMCRR
jgi:hypothetical protein